MKIILQAGVLVSILKERLVRVSCPFRLEICLQEKRSKSVHNSYNLSKLSMELTLSPYQSRFILTMRDLALIANLIPMRSRTKSY